MTQEQELQQFLNSFIKKHHDERLKAAQKESARLERLYSIGLCFPIEGGPKLATRWGKFIKNLLSLRDRKQDDYNNLKKAINHQNELKRRRNRLKTEPAS